MIVLLVLVNYRKWSGFGHFHFSSSASWYGGYCVSYIVLIKTGSTQN